MVCRRWAARRLADGGDPFPIVQHDQIQPFTAEEVQRLFRAAKKSVYPARDLALVALLFDTGARASELCSLTLGDHDVIGGSITVFGKGGKRRALHYSKETQRLIRAYQRTLPEDWGPEDPLFPGQRAGPMSRSGLLQLFERLMRRAGLQGYRRSPHCCRHTFAIEFLRSGGSVFALQQMLGHEDLSMTRKYCALAANDLVQDARKHSLVDRVKRRASR